MISFKFRKTNSIKLNWIVTYIILFFLPVFIYISLFIIVDGRIKNEVNKSNSVLLKQVQQYMDTLANDTERLAVDMAFNNKVQSVRGMSGEISDEDRFKLLDIYTDARNKVTNNKAIVEIYIFFNKIDMVVSSNYIMDSDIFFKTFCENNKIDKSEWLNINKDMHRGDYINLKENASNSVEEGKKLAYILSVPNNTNIDGNANIVVVIDKSKFIEMSKDIEALSKGKVAIINNKNDIILSSGNIDGFAKEQYDFPTDKVEIIKDKINNKKVALSYINSKIKNWKYVYSMPVSDYWGTLEQYRTIMISGIIFSIIVGFSAVFVVFKKNYKPVNNLVTALANFKNGNLREDNNEFNFIVDVVTKVSNEKKEVDKWIEAQKEILRFRHLERLLKFRVAEFDTRDREFLDISFQWNNFIVMSIYVGNYEKVTLDNPDGEFENFKLFQFVIQNMLEELIQDKGAAITLDSDSYIVSILNLKDSNQETIQYIKEISYKIQEILKKFYNKLPIIAISNSYSEINLINKAYKETVELIELLEMVGGEKVLLYSEVNNYVPNKYYYPFEFENALTNVVKSGEIKRVKELVKDIFERNLDEKVINNTIAKCLKFNLIGTMTNIVNELADIYGEDYFVYLASIENMASQKNIKKIEATIISILEEICIKIKADKKSGCQIGDRIITYIQENYKDENLNLTGIAEVFDLNSAYLSRQFKVQTGYPILDYIAIVRINQAKKLLIREDNNLDTVAKSVGYSNVRTFTRAFTKIEGITPGKYKVDDSSYSTGLS
jgi:two-component system response regulator YesN